MIPHIIHQSWKTIDIPPLWRGWQKGWKRLHPGFEYRFWTDAENRDFILKHYPHLVDLHDGYPLGVQRAELSRYLILQHYGGVYVDMDFEALRPIDPLIAGRELLFGLEPASHASRGPVRERGLSRIVCNAFMASAPGHPFWDALIARLVESRRESNVLDATGPFLLTRACNAWPGEIAIESADLLYPLDNEQVRGLDPDALREAAGNAYAIHHWSGSWLRDNVLVRARERIAGLRSRD